MEKIKKIIINSCSNIDIDGDVKFITDGLIDSVDLVTIISDLEDEFGIEISIEEIVPENFDTIEAIWEMIQKLV